MLFNAFFLTNDIDALDVLRLSSPNQKVISLSYFFQANM